MVTRTNVFHNLVLKLLHRRRDNSREGSKRNIHAHYDLGNEFYGLWLDPTMTYSSALYDGDEGKPLEAAQTAKYERILTQLGARPGRQHPRDRLRLGRLRRDGGATRHAGHRHHDLARAARIRPARLQRAGLADRVDLQFRDYRDIEGRYDHIVSIEMIEAVGERYWPDYFAVAQAPRRARTVRLLSRRS